MPPETEHPVSITEWLYDPRGLGRYASLGEGAVPYAVAEHAGFPGVQFKITYDADLNARAVNVAALDGGPNLSARFLRDLPYGAIDSAARSHMAWWWREYDKGRSEAAKSAAPIPAESVSAIDIRRPGRRGRPDLDYAELALAYVTWLDTPGAGSFKDFAKTQYVSASQARNLLYEARRRDLLTKAPAGKSGGMLTNRALGLLGSKTHSAPRWTPEQIEAARKRDEPFHELSERQRSGEITGSEYGEQLEQLMRDTFGDARDEITVEPGRD